VQFAVQGGRTSWEIQFATRENLEPGHETVSARQSKDEPPTSDPHLRWGHWGVKEPTLEFLVVILVEPLSELQNDDRSRWSPSNYTLITIETASVVVWDYLGNPHNEGVPWWSPLSRTLITIETASTSIWDRLGILIREGVFLVLDIAPINPKWLLTPRAC